MEENKLMVAKQLMDDFSERTGLSEEIGDIGDKKRRYLWTDAFAVQALFGLAKNFNEDAYKSKALKLIDLVHEHLGSYHPDDERTGRISGLKEEVAKKHPTVGGLRIGKRLPERNESEPMNRALEWEKDGQYFHYNARWITALLQAQEETKNAKYAIWAAELLLSSESFIVGKGSPSRMYWKMSTDLSRPLVTSMGGHDPLEGLICCKNVQKNCSEKEKELQNLFNRFKSVSAGLDWETSDPLGVGGLLLNTFRALKLENLAIELPSSATPDKLLEESLNSLKNYERSFEMTQSAKMRLAFRECGLSLGLRVLNGSKTDLDLQQSIPPEINNYNYLADEIEKFWIDPNHQQEETWREHLDINAVSLASSLIANATPGVF